MFSFRQFLSIIEKRTNSDLNPKISVNQRIKEYLDNAKPFSGSNNINAFASFTKLEKLGINPGSSFDTPIGIYAYPLTYVYKKTNNNAHPGDTLPFAGDMPFINLFSTQGNIVNLNNMTNAEYDDYFKKVVQVYPDIKNYSKAVKNTAKIQTPGGFFWNLTRISVDKNPIKWNKLFRDIGVDGCVDNR